MKNHEICDIMKACADARVLEAKLGGRDGWFRHCAYELACHKNCGWKYSTETDILSRNEVPDAVKSAVVELSEIYLKFSIRASKHDAHIFYANK